MNQMFKYKDGSEIMVRDFVLFDGGSSPGTVEFMVTSAEEMKETRVEEPGVMLDVIPLGLVYLPLSSLLEDPLRFVSRGHKTL